MPARSPVWPFATRCLVVPLQRVDQRLRAFDGGRLAWGSRRAQRLSQRIEGERVAVDGYCLALACPCAWIVLCLTRRRAYGPQQRGGVRLEDPYQWVVRIEDRGLRRAPAREGRSPRWLGSARRRRWRRWRVWHRWRPGNGCVLATVVGGVNVQDGICRRGGRTGARGGRGRAAGLHEGP